MAIIRLSESTINLIAAGEVVERPASVIKELVENSIDSGAQNIEIYLEQAGKNLISVIDDGCGMSADDMLLAVERHTTSKLNELDILDIQFFGFRGEALPSIASVSKFSITSRLKGSSSAYSLHFLEGNPYITETVSNVGTKIEVRDLFYSIPARLKFLKTDQTELANCLEVIKRLALTSPTVAFTVIHEDRTLLKLSATDDVKVRVTEVLGDVFAANSVEIELLHDVFKVYGYVSLPTYHKASSDEQFTFVNSRPVKDKLLAGSIKAAYQDYIVQGRFAPLVIFIDVPYKLVDVNVHPAKSEVRFQEAGKIRGAVVNAIRNAVSRDTGVTNTLTDQAISYFSYNPPVSSAKFPTALAEQSGSYRPQKFASQQGMLDVRNLEPQTYVPPDVIMGVKEIPLQNFPLGFACAQLHNNYIVSQTDGGVVIVDQHAAHERIVYEQLKKQLETEALKSQPLLLPLQVKLSSSKKVHLLCEHKEHLAKLALIIEGIDDNTIMVCEVPDILLKKDIAQLISDIADEISEDEQQFSLSKMIESVIETYACHHSVRSGQQLSLSEMNELLRQIETTPASGQCCHGRPTYVTLSLDNMEKLFSRK